MKKFEKEFRAAHPETIGETDKGFDDGNYTEWLELERENLLNLAIVSNPVKNEVTACSNYINYLTALNVAATIDPEEIQTQLNTLFAHRKRFALEMLRGGTDEYHKSLEVNYTYVNENIKKLIGL